MTRAERRRLVADNITKAEARIVELRGLVDRLQEQDPPELRLTAMAVIAALEASLSSLKAQVATDASSALLARAEDYGGDGG